MAWSVLADYFPPKERALPVSVFLMGPYLGAGLALLAGAEVIEWARTVDQVSLPLVGELAPWQFTFIAVGLPGIVIAALLATMAELREDTMDQRRTDAQQARIDRLKMELEQEKTALNVLRRRQQHRREVERRRADARKRRAGLATKPASRV